MAIMVFDIETVPDLQLGRKLLGLNDNESDQVVLQALNLYFEAKDRHFLPHYLQQVVAISVVVRADDWVRVWSLGQADDSEQELVRRFFKGVSRYHPLLVSWNGSGFDLPVLHFRALKHGIQATEYWETGVNDSQYKWNNYLNRYHERHTDVMDVLAAYQNKAFAPLDNISLLLDLPGKMGESGRAVAEQYQAGEIESIRNYCETDVLNTYLIYLRLLFIKGIYTEAKYSEESLLVLQFLQQQDQPHWQKFLQQWGAKPDA